MTRALAVALVVILGLLMALPMAQATEEFRGLYVDAFHPGMKTHEEVTQMVTAAKNANFNALIVQVRKRGDAYYNSHVEPRASDIAADYDPLADVLAQAHVAGLEVHAMISVYDVAQECYVLPDTHVAKKHPEWLMVTQAGTSIQDGGMIQVSRTCRITLPLSSWILPTTTT